MRRLILSVLVMIAGGFYMISCSGGGGSKTGTSNSTFNYNGPGSEWTMTASGNSYTFNIDHGADGAISVDATSSNISATGHILLTVDSASATGIQTAPLPGVQAYAVEIPGTAVILKPLSSNSETIITINSGSCPTSDFVANWVIGQRARTDRASDTGQDWFGAVNWSVTNDELYMPVYRSIEDPLTGIPPGGGLGEDAAGASPVSISGAFGTCSNGKVENYTNACNDGGSIESDIYFTASGLIIVASCKDDSVDESHIIGMPQVAISGTTDLYGNYSGFLFFEGLDTTALSAVVAADGGDHDVTLTLRSGSDLSTVDRTITVSIPNANLNAPANGMFHGTVDGACSNGDQPGFDGNCEVVCSTAANVNNSGRNLLFCVGQSPDDEDQRMTLLMVSDAP